jgi:squalene-associated FAD-dependent desaturase
MNVAVIGGGYAGMAAAVTLAQAGVRVTVYEAAAQLGGRARRVTVNAVALDNGLHILLGAYSETLRLVDLVIGESARALTRLPLQWQIHGRFSLKAPRLPAPLHLVAALLTARGASWRERFAAMRFMREMRARAFQLERDVTVSALLVNHAQGAAFVRWLWEPLCIAALNTPPARASAQTFLNVLRDGLDAGRASSDLLLSRHDLSALFPDPAASYVREHGGTVSTASMVDALHTTDRVVAVTSRGTTTEFDHVICAVSPHRAAALLASFPGLAETIGLLERFRYQPIYSVYLQFSAPVRLPAAMLGMSGTAQWLFDREAICGQRGLIAAVISAEGAHQNMTQDALARAVHEELEAALGPLPTLAWHRVIAEKRATFECTVGLQRPATRTPVSNLHLAGDYTASGYPATIEAAVRSGIAAANQVLQRRL